MVFQARKVALVPLSNTKSTIFTYIVGTDIQEVLYGAERERERERFVFVFFFSTSNVWDFIAQC